MKTLRLGTRKSALAQAQAKWVADHLRSAFSDLKIELIFITTSGDQPSPNASLALSPGERVRGEGGLKALFTKEIEEALLDNKIDLAVHSLKDMAAELPKGLTIGAIPEREDPRDVWISKTNVPFKQIPAGSKIGTGAIRRQAQLKRISPQSIPVAIRGNVDTRLRKLADGELDGLILALAGLKRLGRESAATEVLLAEMMVPAVGQGCLAIEVREKDNAISPYLKSLDHAASHAAATAERAFLKTLGGSCQTPIAANAQLIGNQLRLVGLVISPDGVEEIRSEHSGPLHEAEAIGHTLAKTLITSGAKRLLS